MITHSHQIITIGRRKTSVARVVLKPGSGPITVNRRALEHYFPVDTMRSEVLLPFAVTETVGKYDVVANVRGGGLSGQAGAVSLEPPRPLVELKGALGWKLRVLGLPPRSFAGRPPLSST